MKTVENSNEAIVRTVHAPDEVVEELLTNYEMVEIKGGKRVLASNCNRCTTTCVRKA